MLNENPAPNSGLGWDDARLADEMAAAMRDLAGTVTDARPLRLTAQAPATSRARAARRARGSRRWSWGAPVLAAVAVVAVAVALVTVRDSPNGRVTTPSPRRRWSQARRMCPGITSPGCRPTGPTWWSATPGTEGPRHRSVAERDLPQRRLRHGGGRPHVHRHGDPGTGSRHHRVVPVAPSPGPYADDDGLAADSGTAGPGRGRALPRRHPGRGRPERQPAEPAGLLGRDRGAAALLDRHIRRVRRDQGDAGQLAVHPAGAALDPRWPAGRLRMERQGPPGGRRRRRPGRKPACRQQRALLYRDRGRPGCHLHLHGLAGMGAGRGRARGIERARGHLRRRRAE